MKKSKIICIQIITKLNFSLKFGNECLFSNAPLNDPIKANSALAAGMPYNNNQIQSPFSISSNSAENHFYSNGKINEPQLSVAELRAKIGKQLRMQKPEGTQNKIPKLNGSENKGAPNSKPQYVFNNISPKSNFKVGNSANEGKFNCK